MPPSRPQLVTPVKAHVLLLAALLARNGKPAEAWQAYEEGVARGTWDDLASRRRLLPKERARLAALRKASGRPVYLLSGATGQGVPEVLRVLQDTIHEARRAQAERDHAA